MAWPAACTIHSQVQGMLSLCSWKLLKYKFSDSLAPILFASELYSSMPAPRDFVFHQSAIDPRESFVVVYGTIAIALFTFLEPTIIILGLSKCHLTWAFSMLFAMCGGSQSEYEFTSFSNCFRADHFERPCVGYRTSVLALHYAATKWWGRIETNGTGKVMCERNYRGQKN